ncbi:phage minor capsid protein [Streptomyces sp. AM 2-1-1]|uniref:phage minor capsid protein n=1 Tax=Streptomyces sp. AM 2-1-1 TaxID=3028709 RepID=UPI0023BA1CEA|nr:phage minor capsid protein [Streptomyces sp. AM 2-1-1]WEH40790.1 capsid protein [Streptomyces sp. AM 2-1-1]
MPVSPELAENLAAAVADLYEAAQGTIIERIRDALAEGIDSPLWLELKAASIGDLQTAIQAVIDALQLDASGAVQHAVAEAYERGQQAAVAELGALGVGQAMAAAAVVPAASAVDRLANALIADTGPVYLRILRQTMDVYREVIAHASSAPLLGAQTRRQAAQTALDRFTARGVSGFIDRAGRSWDMRSYVEMATRSVVGRAAVDAHTDRLGAAGIELVMVSEALEECPLCRRWEGKILARDGASGERDVEMEHATEDDKMVTVPVAGSLAEARATGLFHPNCRHDVRIYLPGLTKSRPKPPARGTYEDTQRQRYFERQIRMWKRKAAGAMDEQTAAAARARVRDYQGRIRDLVAETGLPRKRHREQLAAAR